jgi:putative oxidoreductase
MRKLTSVTYSASAFNTAMFLLRVGSGVLLMSHGYSKLVHFADMKNKFINFMGLGTTLSLSLTIFAEFFCAIFVIIGLFTRLVVIPPIVNLCVALFVAHHGDVFGDGEKAALYLLCFITILLCGPGRASVDGMIR